MINIFLGGGEGVVVCGGVWWLLLAVQVEGEINLASKVGLTRLSAG